MTKEKAITELLAKLYPTPQYLHLFLSSLKFGSGFLPLLNFNRPHNFIVFDVVDQIRMRGLIDADLFEYLQKEWPTNAEIPKVREMWLTDPVTLSKLQPRDLVKDAAKSPIIFVSYSHKDANFYEELETHLSILGRKGLINLWQEGRIDPGQEWDQYIKSQFEEASITILLVSADFLASTFLESDELRTALTRPDKEKRIIPVILRPCDWQSTILNSVQVFPPDGKPIALSNNPDRQWLDLSNSIKRLALNWRESL